MKINIKTGGSYGKNGPPPVEEVEKPSPTPAPPAPECPESEHPTAVYWRKYSIAKVTVTWEEKMKGEWRRYEKEITHEEFLTRFSVSPPSPAILHMRRVS